MPSIQQTQSRDPSPPRSETVGRDDEDTNFDAIHSHLAPFDANNELGDWVFSKEAGNWWRLSKSTNSVIWMPTVFS